MKVSFFCKLCGIHLRQGDHSECKKILRKVHRSEQRRLSEGKRGREGYASGRTNRHLQD